VSNDALEESGIPLLPSKYLHDLRTPLNQIIGYSEMLEEQAQDDGQTGYISDIKKIQAAGRQLLGLLGNGSAQASGVPTIKTSGDIPLTELLPRIGADPSTLGSSQALILVVDDNEVNRDLLSRRLQREGYAVETSGDGADALSQVRSKAFDLVLLDIMMPEMDGYQVLEAMKADPLLHDIPVIMISALDELESVVRCIEMGAEDYLPKPFEPTLLKARIGACLERKHAHDREMRLYGQCQKNYIRLQELEKLRDDLTHMIVHDLRTPLTSVITGMQTMEVMGELNEGQQEIMAITIDSGQTLLEMINGLLDVEQMESGTMQLKYSTISAADLVAVAVGQVAQLAASSKLALHQDVPADLPKFAGDENKLRRTLVNLLGNSIKFTPEGGSVTVGAKLDSDSLRFSVTDTGEGIPAEDFSRIFEKFGQVESRKGGRVMSTGLGLTFCKLAVNAHGGDIEVESVPGHGSTFSFTIPLNAPASASAGA
jgi:two-component system sensor histidine kinase/response regulator